MPHKYEVVASRIRQNIEERSLKPNDALPSEREMMAVYGVSRMTVRAAISRLIDEGSVYNVHGSGTYVGSPEHVAKGLTLTSFTEDMTSRGFTASSRLLEVARVGATDVISGLLGVEKGTECTKITRLRLADGHPMALETVYVVALVLPLEEFDASRSLYDQLESRGHEVVRAHQQIKAVTPDSDQCELLGVSRGAAALCVDRVASDRRGNAVEFASTIYRGDRYSFEIGITKENREL